MVEYDKHGVPIGCPMCGQLKGNTVGCCKVEEPVEETVVKEVVKKVEKPKKKATPKKKAAKKA